MESQTNQQQKTPSENTEIKQNQEQLIELLRGKTSENTEIKQNQEQLIELLRGKTSVLIRARLRAP